MELHAVTGQLFIEDGEVRDGTAVSSEMAFSSATAVPGILAQSAPGKAARGRESDFLFVHLTLTGQVTETAVLLQDLLDTISQRYYQTSGSVTAALRRALTEANDLLLRLNLSGSGPTREGAVTCAALRHGELFVLQIGESLAMLGHNFGIERLPARTPDHITPFGRSAGLDIRYSHHHLQAGDMLLLVDPRLAHLPTQSFEPALVDTEVEIGLGELVEIVGPDSARLLLVEFTDDAPLDLPEASPRRLGEMGTAVPPTPIPQTAMPSHPAHQPLREQLPAPIRNVDVEHTARKATSEAAMGLSRFTGWLAELIGRLRSPRPETDNSVNLAWAGIIAIAIPLIIAIIVSSVYIQRGRVRRIAEIKEEMGQNLVLAESAESETDRRVYYQTMLLLAEEGDTLRPNDSEINRLRQEAYTALDLLDGVQRLTAHSLYTFDEGVNLSHLTLQDGFNGGIYALDAAGGGVYRLDTDESYLTVLEEPLNQLIFRQQAIGSHVVGNVIDLLWRPAGNMVSRDGIAMLDSRGALLTYYPNFTDTRAVPLGLSSEWQLPVAMATYDERIYVLDVGSGQIWKYFPSGEGFEVSDEDRVIAFREDPELALAVDFDLYSEDASLVVLYGDGRIRYYDTRSGSVQWDEAELMRNGLTRPLVSPTVVKMVGRGLNTSIFVADPGSGRIIKIARSGTVLAQYRANDEAGQSLFTHISDLAIAETPLRIFVTAGNQVYVAMQE
ncbi:MAG: hypothetical protein H6662_18370 [Ardenticatenaceae bacterium]|nr:hypothetical protein [Anaerolineales bacterium]MCB8923557.1 hypothetical protein [Ardenticatenaceae bacterium]MCB8991705.1 hypothetical protein [Ardenticatenaceae bacterium]